MTPASQAAFNYGYDCADELVGISNNGSSSPPSCGPSTFVNYTGNISASAQVAFNLDEDGNPVETLVDGVETVMTRDEDERVTSQTFGAYASPAPTPSYGGLTYQYDADGRLIDKGASGGLQAVVNIPSAVSTTSYSATDQVASWNNVSSTTDHASNITSDPASGNTLTWNARNQASTVAGASEAYDGLGRRESSTGSAILNFDYDGSAMIGWSSTAAGSYNFTTTPGGGALAGSFTANDTTTTWVPLIDTSGSTIGLVNAANVDSGPVTTYTYDPSGTPTVSGTTNDWPFQYQGMEKEVTDPGTYYYTGSGQFYSPQLVRSLSEAGQTGSSGTGGPSARQVPYGPGSQGNGSFGHWYVGQLGPNSELGDIPDIPVPAAEGLYYWIPAGEIAQDIEELVSFFEWLFGGSSAPPTPRQLFHGRHPLYPVILGVQDGLIPTEVSDGPVIELHSSHTTGQEGEYYAVQEVVPWLDPLIQGFPEGGGTLTDPIEPWSLDPSRQSAVNLNRCLDAAADTTLWDNYCSKGGLSKMQKMQCISAKFQSVSYREGLCRAWWIPPRWYT
jgi:hypothetical protein